MIDISDGLSTDLGHICDESEVGAVVYAEALPSASAGSPDRRPVSGHGFTRAVRTSTISRALARNGSSRESQPLSLALHGGDEYELLFTAPPNRRIPKQIAGVPVTRIGEILRRQQMKLATADGKTHPLKPAGWEHFGG
jgi:thiamine-monophosphate kinase